MSLCFCSVFSPLFIILLFQGVVIEIVVPVSIFGLASIWLVGWRRGRQAYRCFYSEELTRHPDEWKDYYRILKICPRAESEAIIVAYRRLSHVLDEGLSDEEKRISLYSMKRREVNEAYQVLSDPVTRASYDRVFCLKRGAEDMGVEFSDKREIINLAQHIAQYMQEIKTTVTLTVPGWGKVVVKTFLAAIIAIFLILFSGTSLALAKPEHTLATPFKGIAITLTKAASDAIVLIEDARGIVAMHERSIISTALQSMRSEESLKQITPVVVSTKDMACFPS
ncbi:J domain-containing protein [Chloroflexota bacterium]